MAYLSDSYKPNQNSRAILEAAWQHVTSVDYRVSSRWLFYRLLQDGAYTKKDDYNGRFLPLLSRARHNRFGPWRPDSLVDDTRRVIAHRGGARNAMSWVRAVSGGVACRLDHWHRQTNYVEFWFEAAAMRSQFAHYTQGVSITLRPFQGMPSIDFKYQAAQELAEAADKYGLPVVVCYFGDYDEAGRVILETSMNDVRRWCQVEFAVDRVGLNAGDGQRLGIPENFEKPGVFQWEALPDEAARRLIFGAIDRYIDRDAVRVVNVEAAKVTAAFGDYMSDFDEYWSGLSA